LITSKAWFGRNALYTKYIVIIYTSIKKNIYLGDLVHLHHLAVQISQDLKKQTIYFLVLRWQKKITYIQCDPEDHYLHVVLNKNDSFIQTEKKRKIYIPYVSSPANPFSPISPLPPGIPKTIKCLYIKRKETQYYQQDRVAQDHQEDLCKEEK